MPPKWGKSKSVDTEALWGPGMPFNARDSGERLHSPTQRLKVYPLRYRPFSSVGARVQRRDPVQEVRHVAESAGGGIARNGGNKREARGWSRCGLKQTSRSAHLVPSTPTLRAAHYVNLAIRELQAE